MELSIDIIFLTGFVLITAYGKTFCKQKNRLFFNVFPILEVINKYED